jgi:subtilase family serine protease
MGDFGMRLSLRGLGLSIGSLAIVSMLTFGARDACAQVAALAGNHSPAVDQIASAPNAPSGQMLSMRIDLKPSHRNELDALLAAQQDPKSPEYHQWLKTGEFDRRFGPDAASREAIAQWLKQQGFEVAESSDIWTVRFSGTVAQAQHTFEVAIKSADGGKHFGNVGDPAVPTQFASAIAFVDGLDNLRAWRTPLHTVPGSPADADSAPLVTYNNQSGFGPSDFYTFYDVNPLLNDNITGTGGGCIGLIEASDYSATGIDNFDNAFGLPTANVTKVIAPDSDNPGTNDREDESMLDIEYAHTFAPSAAINFYLADPNSSTNQGNVIYATVDALNTAVNQNTCSAISISIETCGFQKSYFTGALHTTYMKAASQGQTVFVAEGDEGAAEFQYDSSTGQCVLGTTRNVNELASDPNVTSIGGTQFNPTYDSKGNDVGSVAESVWNEGVEYTDLGSGGGGASTVWTKSEAPFQATGTPDDGARDVPDISMEAACHTPGAFSVFPDQSTKNSVVCCVCGTSLGAPVWAGITELMVQNNSNERLGSINTKLYELGNMQDSAATGIRDVTTGNNDYNGVTGFDAVAGYDQASGWGTPDVTQFVTAFVGPPASPSPSATATPTMTATPTATATPIPGKLSVAPAVVNFGAVEENTTSKAKTIRLTNIARPTRKLAASSITIESAIASSPFAVVTNGCTTPINPEKSCEISLTFSPTPATSPPGDLTITYDIPGASTKMVTLRGVGRAPRK